MAERAQRVAFMLLPGLDHFAPDLIARLPCLGLEVRGFAVRSMADLAAACAWADDAGQDVIWFEFCWPPFPAMIAAHDFGGRRVVMRIHRIEAYETPYAANAPWAKIDDVIVVSGQMAALLKAQVPALQQSTALHVVHNGVDTERFACGNAMEPFRIGWCGSLILRKNPIMALEILHLLRSRDARWRMHLSSQGGDPVAIDSFIHLKRRLGLDDAVFMDGKITAADMPAWHARNAVLLSTSVHESFGYAMAEAASCGCDVVMLDQVGADEFWPGEMRFGTASEAACMIQAAQPGRWRAMVAQRFALDRQIEKLRAILRPADYGTGLLHIGHADDVLDMLSAAPNAVKLHQRPAGEMQAAAFLLEAMGYVRTTRSRGSAIYVSGN